MKTKQEPQWIAAADRLPTAEDADCFENVWCCQGGRVVLANWEGWQGYFKNRTHVYWMRTGWVKPEPVCKK